jgi:hypothetical protein
MTYNFFKTGITAVLVTGFLFASGVHAAFASNIIFQGTNPAFFPNANPGGIAQIMDGVTKPAAPSSGLPATLTSPAALIEQSLEAQISNTINNEIFNTSNPSGTYDLGGGNIVSFVRSGGNVVIDITAPNTGTTVITLPDI